MLQKDTASILIVEDEQSARILMGRIAERHSNKIYHATNGLEGLEIYKKYKPDIIITDIKMHGMDGLAMIQKIEDLGLKKPIVILATAYSEAEYFIRAIELKVDHLLIKPLEAEVLDEKIEKSITILQNSNENKKLKLLLELQTKKISTIFNFQSNIVILTNGNEIKDANQAFLDFFGFKNINEFNTIHKSIQEFFISGDGFLKYDTEEISMIKKVIAQNDIEHLVKIYDKKRESERIFVLKAAIYPEEDELYIVSLTDISDIEKNRKLLRALSTTDKLTKIFNKFKFDEILTLEISRCKRYKTPLSILMFDIDLFETINDSHGSNAGDQLLKELTNIVKPLIRTSDSFARWSNDEFAIILPNTTLESAVVLAEKIRELVENHSFKAGNKITISTGS